MTIKIKNFWHIDIVQWEFLKLEACYHLNFQIVLGIFPVSIVVQNKIETPKPNYA